MVQVVNIKVRDPELSYLADQRARRVAERMDRGDHLGQRQEQQQQESSPSSKQGTIIKADSAAEGISHRAGDTAAGGPAPDATTPLASDFNIEVQSRGGDDNDTPHPDISTRGQPVEDDNDESLLATRQAAAQVVLGEKQDVPAASDELASELVGPSIPVIIARSTPEDDSDQNMGDIGGDGDGGEGDDKPRGPLHLQSSSSPSPEIPSQLQTQDADHDQGSTTGVLIKLETQVVRPSGDGGVEVSTTHTEPKKESITDEVVESTSPPLVNVENKDIASTHLELSPGRGTAKKADPILSAGSFTSDQQIKADPHSDSIITIAADDDSPKTSSAKPGALSLPATTAEEESSAVEPEECGTASDDDMLVAWTAEQHRAFVSAVFEIGLKNCSPSVIMDAMKNLPSDISREKTKSHLQKFRKTTERNLIEFMEEYDHFMKVVEGKELTPEAVAFDPPKTEGIKSEQEEGIPETESADSDKKNETPSIKPEPATEVKKPADLLEAALRGRDPDALLGGTAAAYVAYSVANNCPMKENRNQIEYDGSREDFPILSDEEKKSSLGQSLMKVKGALDFVTEFVLKNRHGIPMKLDKKIPPFLAKEDIATVVPFFAPPGTTDRKGGGAQQGQQFSQTQQTQRGAMHPPNQAGYPHFSAPQSHGNLHPAGFFPQQPSYVPLAVPSGAAVYPPFGVPVPMGGMHPPAPNLLATPYLAQPFPNPSIYPPPTMMSASYGHHPMSAPTAPGNPYHAPPHPYLQSHLNAGGYAGCDPGHVGQLQHYAGHHHPAYVVGQQEALSRIESTTSTTASVPSNHEPLHHQHPPADDSRRTRGRHQVSEGADDHDSPAGHHSLPSPQDNSSLRNIFDTTPPSAHHRRDAGDRHQRLQDSARSGKSRSSSASRHSTRNPDLARDDSHAAAATANLLSLSSPIQRTSSSSSKKSKRSWSPPRSTNRRRGDHEEQHSKRPRGGIFRLETSNTPPTSSSKQNNEPREYREELERPGSNLSFNMEELGLHPHVGTPSSETGVSPMSMALRDMMWDPLAIDSKDHERRRSGSSSRRTSRGEGGSSRCGDDHRGHRQQTGVRPSPENHSILFSPSGDSTSTRNSAATVDRVALDFGLNVSGGEEDHGYDAPPPHHRK